MTADIRKGAISGTLHVECRVSLIELRQVKMVKTTHVKERLSTRVGNELIKLI